MAKAVTLKNNNDEECDSYNKTSFSLDSANPMFDAHIEVWWHE